MRVNTAAYGHSEGMITHYFAAVILVAIGFHIPDDLMAEQLRYL